LKRIDVVAGIIYNEDRTEILLALRPSTKHQGDLWEFPGGKIETGESPQTALIRELKEEIGITPKHIDPYVKLNYDYPDKKVCLDFWQVTQFVGVPVGVESQKIEWVPITQLREYRFPAANDVIVQKLTQ